MKQLTAGPWLRGVRAALTGGVAFVLGMVAHLSAGGLLPSAGWLAATLALVCAGSAMAMGGPAGLWTLGLLVGGGQFAVHLVLTALAGHRGDVSMTTAAAPVVPAVPTSSRSGSLDDLTFGARNVDSGGDQLVLPHWIQHMVEDLSGPHAVMALAHLLAAATVALWLALGESAMWALICCLGLVVLVLVRGVRFVRAAGGTDRRPTPGAPTWAWVRPLPPPLLGAQARRGPPPVCVA